MRFDCVLLITIFEIAAFILRNSDGMHGKWKILGKIVLCDNNLFIMNTKRMLIFHGPLYSLTMILVFKHIYNTYYSEKNDERHYATSPEMRMTSVISLHSNVTSDNAVACLYSKRQIFNFVYFHSSTLKWPSRWITGIFQHINNSLYKHFYVICIIALEITWLIVVIIL